ncbi:MAG TPA: hypothetical protein VFO89_07085, partial [Thermoanaerobaculia bacterium]|nr:hypothetical protein [Thermoanaerobaculia bacterium]
YSFRYEGVLAFAPAVAAIKEEGKLDTRVELDLKEAEKKLAAEEGFREVEYLGNGRYRVLCERSGVVDRRIDLLSKELRILTLSPADEGIEITGMSVSEKEREQLREIGLGLDGTVRVVSGLRVSTHNAPKSPMLGGLIGAYEWHLTLDEPTPPSLLVTNEPARKPVLSAAAGGVGAAAVVALLLGVVLLRRKRPAPASAAPPDKVEGP